MHVNWSEHEPQTNNKKRTTEWTSGREKKLFKLFFYYNGTKLWALIEKFLDFPLMHFLNSGFET